MWSRRPPIGQLGDQRLPIALTEVCDRLGQQVDLARIGRFTPLIFQIGASISASAGFCVRKSIVFSAYGLLLVAFQAEC